MTQYEAVHKTKSANTTSAGRREFLAALYQGSPDNLYLELRCIHPTTGEARSLWEQMRNKGDLAAALKQADRLNREGFGVYFAPCLRKTRQGKAEAAALVPALWVDIDCDERWRKQGLERLRGYDPAPSFVLDSGGGWHGYWLLDEPFHLTDEAARQKIGAILRGLFTALGGDPEYVKTVAGIMRLPESVNTKPERGGALVSIVECCLERRYPLAAFEWIESQPHVADKVGSLNVVTLKGNGQQPLPRRTENYLTSGAVGGQRNDELFAAACQMRDAGYRQSDAERELIPRYMADGTGGDNSTAREREARATIQSAYSRPPREPISQPRQTARACIDTLVNHYRRHEAEPESPTAQQIREAVAACASLDALEWAEQRKRLRAICGDTFRVEDLNQMYKQARRDRERSQRPELASSPRYVEVDGSMVFEKPTERGTTRQTVANWTGRVAEWIIQVNDDGLAEHIMRLELRHAAHATTLDAPSELFGDANALQRFIAQKAGGIYAVCAGMNKHLPSAILELSGRLPTRQTYPFVGWTQIDGKWVYVSPGVSISADGCLSEPPEVELESRLRDYRLSWCGWTEALAAFKAVVATLPPQLSPALVAFTLLPVVQRFFPAAASPKSPRC